MLTLIPKHQQLGKAIASTFTSVYDSNNSITYDFTENTYKTIIAALLSKMATDHSNHPAINQLLDQTSHLNTSAFNRKIFTTPQYSVTTPQSTQDMNYHIIDHLIRTEDIALNPGDDVVLWHDLALLQDVEKLLIYT